jgi:RHS repeat-associated protein
MPPALKHLDPIIGVDIHLIQLPAPGPPVPIPHPYVGMIFDVTDYIPFIGATVKVNGLPRAKAGTSGQALPPHIPIGGTFIKPPTNESETFLGSATVAADGDPFVYAGLPILTCQDIGMPAQPRADKQNEPKSLMLPMGQAIPIPAGPLVMVGGPPSFLAALKAALQKLAMSMAAKRLAALAMKSKKLVALAEKIDRMLERASELAHALLDKVLAKLGLSKATWLRNFLSRKICSLTGHPVDVATGKVLTEQVDFELPGPIPLRWERVWYSTSTHRGPLGYGWHHPYDAALMPVGSDAVAVRLSDGRGAVFLAVREGEEQFDRKEKLTLFRDRRGYGLRDASGIVQRFGVAGPPGEPLKLVAVEDASDNRIRFEYDERGRLARIVDSGGRELVVRSDAQGRIVEIWGPHPTDERERARLASYVYDESDNLAAWTDPLGNAMRFAYRGHLLVREMNRNGLSFYFDYDGDDENARCLRTWGDGGIYDHKLTYAEGQTVVVNSLGCATTYFHRGGAVYRTVDARGGVTETERNRWAELEREVDAVGGTTTYERDARGNATEIAKADGANVVIEYDRRDRPVSVVDEIGGRWTWRYDEHGRMVERGDPIGRSVRFEWLGGRLARVTGPGGQPTGFEHTASGQVAAIVHPNGARERWSYDRLGRLAVATDPRGNDRTLARDAAGRVVRVLERDGNVREIAYDAEGNVVRARDRLYDAAFAYRGMNRLVERTQGGTSVAFEYDAEEQLVGIRNEHGLVYRFALDEAGHVREESGFDGVRRTYERDLAGRAVRVVRMSGVTTTYAYDAVGRVVAARHSTGEAEHYAFRGDGSLLEAGNATTVVKLERDAVGRIVKETQGDRWVESVYAPGGARSHVRSSMGATVAIERDAIEAVTKVTAGRGALPAQAAGKPAPEEGLGDASPPRAAGAFEADFVRDSVGLELQRTLPGGIQSRWERDKLGRPIRHEVVAGRAWRAEWTYSWDVGDRLRSLAEATRSPVHFTHDALGQLAAATRADGHVDLRMPDAVGNLFRTRERTDRTYGPAGQLLESRGPAGVTRYDYDADGNLVRKTEPGHRVWHYEWNAAGMLVRVIRPDGWPVQMGYDAFARRVFKKFKGTETRWVWDRDVPLHEWTQPDRSPAPRRAVSGDLAEAEAIATRQREAVLGAQPAQGPPPGRKRPQGTADDPLTWLFEPETFSPLGVLAGGETFGIVTDHLGTPVRMYDGLGQEVWGASLDVYGQLRDVRGERGACPFRWPGQYEDEETGLYFNRFRYYDPEAGQYASQDPIGLRGGLNPRQYVPDPCAQLDPLGLSSTCGGSAADVATPYGPAAQGTTPSALTARTAVSEGAPLYRVGTMGKSAGPEGQFWALEHPLSPGYAARYGIPPENVTNANFIETATLRPGTPFVTRTAPAVGANPGGGTEVVVAEGGVVMQSFSTM